MEQLSGRVAVVTGSASGLGRAMAERFAQEGMTVVIADRRFTEAESTAKEIESAGGKAVAIDVDVTKRESVQRLADRVDDELGGAAVLVNNAGVMPLTPILEPEEQNWRWIFDVNVFGVVHGLQVFVPRMLTSGSECHVVNTASLAGMGAPGGVKANRITLGGRIPDAGMWAYGYTSTKAAVVALTETLAIELSGTPVGVSLLVPGSHASGSHLLQNSTINRPPEYGGAFDMQKMMAAFASSLPEARTDEMPPGGYLRDPAVLAMRVVRAIREGHFYIFSHPENRAEIQHRFSEIMAGFDDADSFTE